MSRISVSIQETDPGKAVVMLIVNKKEGLDYKFLNDQAHWIKLAADGDDIPDNCHLHIARHKIELVPEPKKKPDPLKKLEKLNSKVETHYIQPIDFKTYEELSQAQLAEIVTIEALDGGIYNYTYNVTWKKKPVFLTEKGNIKKAYLYQKPPSPV